MKLRYLEKKDAIYMLEWMHDENVVENLQANFSSKTLNDCDKFIENSLDDSKNLQLAIVDDNDEYMGTVSLKHINHKNKMAEFAIVVRACAMGRGFSKFAMREILNIGLEKLGLSMIYWCVSPQNIRAVKFYDKNGYARIDVEKIGKPLGYDEDQIKMYYWYIVRS